MIKKEKMKFNILIIAFIPLLIFLLSFRLLVFDNNFYEKEFYKNQIYDRFTKEIVDKEVNNLFDYFINDKELNTNFFNQKEKIHLKDVKSLINSAINLLLLLSVLFFITLIYYYKKKRLYIFFNSLILGGFLTLFFILLLFILTQINFNSLFFNFHLLVFSNEYWLLNPKVDNLILLFPLEFFYDVIIRIIIYSFLISLVLIIFSVIIKNRIKHSKA